MSVRLGLLDRSLSLLNDWLFRLALGVVYLGWLRLDLKSRILYLLHANWLNKVYTFLAYDVLDGHIL
jgi:hypothetical protein